MATSTSTTVGLMAIGFFILLMGGGYWWFGVGVIMLSMAMAVTGGSSGYTQAMPYPQMNGPSMSKPAKKASKMGSVNDPFHFKPTIPPDGIAGISSIAPEKGEFVSGDPGNLSLGKRTGAMSMYLDATEDMGGAENAARIRIKEDLRLNLPFMQIKDSNGIRPFTNLFTAHFRTTNPIINTKPLEPTFESIPTEFDTFAKESDAADAEKRRRWEEWKSRYMS